AVFQMELLLDSGFAGEIEFGHIAPDLYVARPEGCQAITAIFTCVSLASGSKETGGKDSEHRGHHRFSCQTRLFNMRSHGRAHFWQSFGELDHPAELLRFLPFDVTVVIKVLQAAGGILPDCLHRSARSRVDPDVAPGRRDFQFMDSLEIPGVYLMAVDALVSEASRRRSNTPYPRFLELFESGHRNLGDGSRDARKESWS